VKGSINDCMAILKAAGLTGWQLGRTKVFLKYHHSTTLVECMGRYHTAANIIARAQRIHIGRRRRGQLRAEQESARVAERAARQRDAAEAADQVAKKDKERAAQEAVKVATASAAALVSEWTAPLPLPTAVSAPRVAAPATAGPGVRDRLSLPSSFVRQGSITLVGGEDDVGRGGDQGPQAPASKSIAPVKGADPKKAKIGTLSKGDVGAAKALFMAMAAEEDALTSKTRRQSALPSVNVRSKAKALKIQFPPMSGSSLSHGPALPWARAPWKSPIDRIDEESGAGAAKAQVSVDLDSFLAEVGVLRFYAELCIEVGISEPADFLLFSHDELAGLGFNAKPAHAKKILAAADKLATDEG
jgi:hypothetical protein